MGNTPIDDDSDAPTTVVRAGTALAEDLRRAAQQVPATAHAAAQPTAAPHADAHHPHHHAEVEPTIVLRPARAIHPAAFAFLAVFFGVPLLWATGFARTSWIDALGDRWFGSEAAAPAPQAPPAEPAPAG